MPLTLAWVPGHWELIVILIVALLIFGRRLPDVGRSLGRGIVEFKKGLKGFKDEFESVDQDVRSAGDADDASQDSRRLESQASDPPPGNASHASAERQTEART